MKGRDNMGTGAMGEAVQAEHQPPTAIENLLAAHHADVSPVIKPLLQGYAVPIYIKEESK